jgi:hypothetical protein
VVYRKRMPCQGFERDKGMAGGHVGHSQPDPAFSDSMLAEFVDYRRRLIRRSGSSFVSGLLFGLCFASRPLDWDCLASVLSSQKFCSTSTSNRVLQCCELTGPFPCLLWCRERCGTAGIGALLFSVPPDDRHLIDLKEVPSGVCTDDCTAVDNDLGKWLLLM